MKRKRNLGSAIWMKQGEERSNTRKLKLSEVWVHNRASLKTFLFALWVFLLSFSKSVKGSVSYMCTCLLPSLPTIQ
jgi:hypothetical protein